MRYDATVRIGDYCLHIVRAGPFHLDGGAMFGVVPKALWARRVDCDEHNRIPMAANCLLLRSAARHILIDTGYPLDLDERTRRHHGIDTLGGLITSLAALGLAPADIDTVILTHLHFDHAGGATRRDEHGNLTPTFPRARHIVQRSEWLDAVADLPELAGAYFPDALRPLEAAGLLELIEGDGEVAPGVRVEVTAGHTVGHQIVRITGGDDREALFLADLCPTAAHLPRMWCMAYDQQPLVVRRLKPHVLADAADRNALVIFEHDAQVTGAYLQRDDKREFTLRETIDL